MPPTVKNAPTPKSPTITTPVKVKQPKKDAPKKYKFRLLRARHIETTFDDTGKKNNVVHQVTRHPDTKEYQCPIFESTKELDVLFNVQGFPPKFQRIGNEPTIVINPTERIPGESVQQFLGRLSKLQATISSVIVEKLHEIDSLGDDELVAYAEAEEIEIDDSEPPVKIRERIKKHYKG